MTPLKDVTLDYTQQAGMVHFNAPLLVGRACLTNLAQTYKSSYTLTTGSVAQRPHPDWGVVGAYVGELGTGGNKSGLHPPSWFCCSISEKQNIARGVVQAAAPPSPVVWRTDWRWTCGR
jgi:hypothetical protein